MSMSDIYPGEYLGNSVGQLQLQHTLDNLLSKSGISYLHLHTTRGCRLDALEDYNHNPSFLEYAQFVVQSCLLGKIYICRPFISGNLKTRLHLFVSYDHHRDQGREKNSMQEWCTDRSCNQYLVFTVECLI